MPLYRLALALTAVGAMTSVAGQSLQLVSGQGQIVAEQTVARTFRVRAVDSAGRGIPGVSVAYSVAPQTTGNFIGGATHVTDANGYAEATLFASSSSQPNVSFFPFTITATSTAGNVEFRGVVTARRTQTGDNIAPPGIQLLAPTGGVVLEGTAGSTIPGALQVKVFAQGGVDVNKGIPNVGIRVRTVYADAGEPSASCNGPGGVALTNQEGIGTCDLVLGTGTGLLQLLAVIGEASEFLRFDINVRAGGPACTYSVAPSSFTLNASPNNGSVTLTTAANCAWTAQSNSPWINVVQPSGVGPASVQFSVGPNLGPARTGSLTVGGQTVVVTQNATGAGSSLAFFTAATLPPATVGNNYGIALSAVGGTPPYEWTGTNVPAGLTLNASNGALSGVPATPGTFTFPVTVRDAAGAVVTQNFTLTVSPQVSGGTLSITNTSFPNGVAGTAYQQAVTTSGGCASPFAGPPQISVAAGALPTGLSVQPSANGFAIAGTPTASGTFSFTLQATACSETTTRAFSMVIAPAAGTVSLTASPSSLTVNAQLGARPLEQPIQITSSGAATQITATATTVNGGNWLSVSPSPATAPGTLTVSFINYESLGSGTYTGSIAVSAANAATINIPVTLNVSPVVQVAVNPLVLAFDHISGVTSVSERAVNVTSTVPGVSAGFTTSVSTSSGGNWLAVIASTATTPASLRVQATSAGLQPGTYQGTVSIAPVSNPAAVNVVRVTLNVAPPATVSVSQTSLVFTYDRQTLPAAQTVNILSTGGPLRFTASATTQSGGSWLSIVPSEGSTPGSISIRVQPLNLPPGTYQGSIAVQPETGGVPVVIGVQLVVTGSTPQINAITNAASFATGAVSPGEMVTIFGTNLGPALLTQLRLTSTGTIDTTLATTRVYFNEVPAPLIYTSAGVVTASVPYSVAASRSVRVQVEYQGVRSPVSEVAVVEAAPGIFAVGGTNQGAIVNADQTINGPGNGAEPGSIVSIYATGEGLTSPASIEGAVTSSVNPPRPLLPVSVEIAGQPAQLQYVGAAPIAPAGMMQVNVYVPAGTPRNSVVPIVLKVGSASSQVVTMVTR